MLRLRPISISRIVDNTFELLINYLIKQPLFVHIVHCLAMLRCCELLSHTLRDEMYQGYRVNKRLADVHPSLDVDAPVEVMYLNRLDSGDAEGGGVSPEFSVSSTSSPNESKQMRHLHCLGEFKVTGNIYDDLRRDFVVDYPLDETDAALCGYIQASENISLSPGDYEVLMSLLDRGAWLLSLQVPLSHTSAVDEAQPCSVCGDAECYPENSIVFCDGCDVAVHQDCYGVPFIPEGQWLCRRCLLVGRNAGVQCKMCPRTSGAFKQTTGLSWVHMLCAQYIPELEVPDDALMEPIEGLESVPYDRYALRCLICKRKKGACIQCAYGNCTRSFHVTCAQAAHLHMEKPSVFCPKHTPGETSAIDLNGARASLELEEKSNEDVSLFSKPHHPYWRTPSGVFCIPAALRDAVSKAWTDITGIEMPLKIMNDLCQFWTIKREARGGMFTRPQRHSFEVAQRSASRPLHEIQILIDKAEEGVSLANQLKDVLMEGVEQSVESTNDAVVDKTSNGQVEADGSLPESADALPSDAANQTPQTPPRQTSRRRQNYRVEKPSRIMNRVRRKRSATSQREVEVAGLLVTAARQASRSGISAVDNPRRADSHSNDEPQDLETGAQDVDSQPKSQSSPNHVTDNETNNAEPPQTVRRGIWWRAFDVAKGFTKTSSTPTVPREQVQHKHTPQRVGRRDLDQAMSVLSSSPQTRRRRQV